MTSYYKKLKLLAPAAATVLCSTLIPFKVFSAAYPTSEETQGNSTGMYLGYDDVNQYDGLYGTANGGVAFVNKFDSIRNEAGFNVGAGLGYKVNNVRTEAEFRFIRAKQRANYITFEDRAYRADVFVQSYAYMGNVYYDFEEYSYAGFVPYVGVGLGYARVVQSANLAGGIKGTASYNTFAYQAMPGISYNFDNGLSANFSYRYLGTTRAGGTHSSFQSHGLNLGLTAYIY